MTTGRMPACDALPLTGYITCALSVTDVQDNMAKYGINQVPNHLFCESIPENTTSSVKKRPHTAEESNRRFQYCIQRIFTGLLSEDIKIKKGRLLGLAPWYFSFCDNEIIKKLLYHIYPNLPGRRRRRDALVTIITVLKYLVWSTDFHRMACGFYKPNNEFHYYNYEDICEATGVSYVTLKRIMLFLQLEGLINVTRNLKTIPNGKIITLDTIIEINPCVFELLGISEELFKDRRAAHNKWRERQTKVDAKRAKLAKYKPEPFNPKRVRPTQKENFMFKKALESVKPKYNPAQDPIVLNKAAKLIEIEPGLTVQEAIRIVVERYKTPPPS